MKKCVSTYLSIPFNKEATVALIISAMTMIISNLKVSIFGLNMVS